MEKVYDIHKTAQHQNCSYQLRGGEVLKNHTCEFYPHSISMICYRTTHMGPQTCANVGGVISSNQFMHPSGEKISLGYLPSTINTSTYIHRTHRQLIFSPQINPLSHFSISIPSSEGSLEGDSDSSQDFFPIFSPSKSDCTDTNQKNKIKTHPQAQVHFPQQGQPIVREEASVPASLSVFKNNDSGSPNWYGKRISVVKPEVHKEDFLAHPNNIKSPKRSKSCLNERFDNNNFHSGSSFIINKFHYKRGYTTTSENSKCMQSGKNIMNEGEEKEFWNRDNENNAKSQMGNSPGDESGSGNSSFQASDNSEDPHGNHITSPEQQQQQGTIKSGDKSSFRFVGPVGKIRRHCRNKNKPGEEEGQEESPMSPSSPLSSTPTTDEVHSILILRGGGGGGVGVGEGYSSFMDEVEMSSEEQKSLEEREVVMLDVDKSVSSQEDTQTTKKSSITSTPTPVIRSVPSSSSSSLRRRENEQPLNLSLPVTLSLEYPPNNTTISRSLSQKNERMRVSVISLAPRERLEEQQSQSDSNFQTDSCPSQSLSVHSSSRSANELSDGRIPNLMQVSPVPSTSRGFYSSGSPSTSSGAPSTFQGLLAARGISPPNDGGPTNPKKKLTCLDCGKEFSQLRNYRYHRSRHEGTQQFACTCPICHKTFNDKGYLSSHLKIHRNAKEYECEWCKKSFNQRVAYNMHIRIHTGHKPHQCPLCDKAFSRKMLLRQHLRTHTGERPYKCLICGKAFADRSNMLLHQRLHSGERPYKCDICQKSFSKNHHLKTHLNHHAGIKPYKCDKCNASFSQSSNMKTHYRKCSGQPSTTATVTSGQFEPTTAVIPGPSSSRLATIPLPRGLAQFRDQEDRPHHPQQQSNTNRRFLQEEEEELEDQESSSQGYPPQLLLHEVGSMNLSSNQNGNNNNISTNMPAPLISPSIRGQSLGFSLGSMGLSSPPRETRVRRASGIPIIPLGNPSPTSLAAGHPFIPLATLESAGLASSLNTSGGTSSTFIPPSSLLLMSPRHHSTINELNSMDFSQFQQFTQQQRSLSSRSSRAVNPHHLSLQSLETFTDNRTHQQQLPSPQQRIEMPRVSPNNNNNNSRQQISPRHLQLPDYYEIVLPALVSSRPIMSQTNQRSPPVNHELVAQQQQSPRSHSFHRSSQRSSEMNESYSSSQQGLLTVSRASSTTGASQSSSQESYSMGSPPPLQLFDQGDHSQQTWRGQRDNDQDKYTFKGQGHFRHPDK